MFISAGIIAVVVGIACFRDCELAWYLYEMDNRMLGIHTEQPRNWRELVYYASSFVIFLGGAAIIMGIKML